MEKLFVCVNNKLVNDNIWNFASPADDAGWYPRIEFDKTQPLRGYHLYDKVGLLWWLGEEVVEVEIDPTATTIRHNNFFVSTGPIRLGKRLNWGKAQAILSMHDCMERIWTKLSSEMKDAVVTLKRVECRKEDDAAACAAKWYIETVLTETWGYHTHWVLIWTGLALGNEEAERRNLLDYLYS